MNMAGVVFCTLYNFPVATPLKKMTSPLPAIVSCPKLLKEGWGSQVPPPFVMEGWSHLVHVFAVPSMMEGMVHLVQVLAGDQSCFEFRSSVTTSPFFFVIIFASHR